MFPNALSCCVSSMSHWPSHYTSTLTLPASPSLPSPRRPPSYPPPPTPLSVPPPSRTLVQSQVRPDLVTVESPAVIDPPLDINLVSDKSWYTGWHYSGSRGRTPPPPSTPLPSSPLTEVGKPTDHCVPHWPHVQHMLGHPVVEIAKGCPNTGGHDPGLRSKQEVHLDHRLI